VVRPSGTLHPRAGRTATGRDIVRLGGPVGHASTLRLA
jgi:hypothetical protein